MKQKKDGNAANALLSVLPATMMACLNYTYHFPKHWSEASVANRNLIKEAQRRAHALEHDNSREALEWRIRFFQHYFTVFKGGAKPESGMKPYSRFYQYTFVAIYRELKHNQKVAEEVSFEPVNTFRSDSQHYLAEPQSLLYHPAAIRLSQADSIRRAVFRHSLRLDQLPT